MAAGAVFKYGDQVTICDGSRLDGATGIVYSTREGEVLVLVDREVFWQVAADRLEFGGSRVAECGSSSS